MTTPQKAKGSQWERDVARYFNGRGRVTIERRYGAGNTIDKGDLNGLPGIVFECKNLGKITLASIMDETLHEQKNAKADFGVAIIKRRGKSPDQGYVVMTLEQWITMLDETER